jgi:S-DNA-T family DNA segregation ATPase FtsK/SpoIIIE
VGAVCGPHDRDEARHLVRELGALVAARERGLREQGGRDRDPRDRARGAGAIPGALERQWPDLDDRGHAEVLLLVDNWARLRQELPDLEPEIEALAATGLHHGVHLVVTANRWADLRLALRDNLGGRLELRLNDPLESAVGRAAAAALPADTPGRGLTTAGLQFQAALPALGVPAAGSGAARWLATALAEIAWRAVQSPDGTVAPPLRMLPTVVTASDLPAAEEEEEEVPGTVPLGLHEHRLAPVWIDLFSGPPHFLVLGDSECGKSGVLRCLAGGLSARQSPQQVRFVVVDYRRTLADLADLPHCSAYACTPGMAAEAAARLRGILEQRLPGPEPSVWRRHSAPRHVLLVDDYHLVTGDGNPLEPLLGLLALGGDVGLHVVLTCAAGGAARAAFDPFLRRLHEIGTPGLVMSGDPRDGPLLSGRAAVPLPPGRGLLIRRQGTSGLVQVAWAPPSMIARALGTPEPGTPAVGTPAAGTPAAGTPAVGTPEAGTPAVGTPVFRSRPP